MPVNPFEPEEMVGGLWHRLVGDLDPTPHFPEAAVELESIAEALAVTFRGLGGEGSVELRSATPEVSHHRLTWRRRLGRSEDRLATARFDGETLFLPATLDVLPTAVMNRRLYLWLVAWSVCEDTCAAAPSDPLQRDLLRLWVACDTTNRVLEQFPGLRPIYRELAGAYLAVRPQRPLPPVESDIEAGVRGVLEDGQMRELAGPAPGGYRPFLPVPLWGERLALPEREGTRRDEEDVSESGGGDDGSGTLKARRKDGSEAERKDSLILHRFESILSWTEFLNLNRMVDDDDAENARRAADDQDEVSLVEMRRRPATRLKFHLDLAPQDVDRERLADVHVYPEWDYRAKAYLPDHSRVLADMAPDEDRGDLTPGDDAHRRIRAVRRQFEALLPRRAVLTRQLDGDELDLDAAIRARCDFLATGETSNRLYRQTRDARRDLAVAVLVDTSRSTESYVENRCVLDVEKEALTALAYGLQSCGDDLAVYAFSSLKRNRVFVQTVKRFEESMGPRIEARIAGLTPGFYTRLGAAIRHVSEELSGRANQRRLLLVLSDGKPNDLDHYEGRYGVEDTRQAVKEARRYGHAVFGATVDAKARSYIARIFGQNGFAILSHPDRLVSALPGMYAHLVA